MSESRCPYCGELIQPDAVFCPFCGQDLPKGYPAEGGSPDGSEGFDDHTVHIVPDSDPQNQQAGPRQAAEQAPDDRTFRVDIEQDDGPWGDHPASIDPPLQPVTPVTPGFPKDEKGGGPVGRYALLALVVLLAAGGALFALLRPSVGPGDTTCTVLFETQGGTPVPAQEVEEGARITSPANPTKDGHTFVAWYLDAQHNSEATFPFVVTEDVTLYAGYEKEDIDSTPDPNPGSGSSTAATYTVSFETSGGSTVAAQTVKDGAQVVSPQDPYKDGYLFEGWYRDAGCTSQVSFPITVTSNMTLYAKWESETPEITTFLVNTNDCLNVRSNPGVVGTEVYYQVHPGVTIYWYGEQQMAKGSSGKDVVWYYVNISGTDVWGWVSALYLSPGTGTDGPPPTPGEHLTINTSASDLVNVRSEPTYFSDSLWELEDGDMVYWDGRTAEGLAKDKKNHTWYYVNVSGTNVWGWVFAEYMTYM